MIPKRRYERADRACEEARLQISQGKLKQPRRLLESALKSAPDHLPTRIALVELAIREAQPQRAVREAKRATSIALLKCREAGLGSGKYASHPVGRLLLEAIYAAGHAHLASGALTEAINAFAAVLQEDPDDSLGACNDLIRVFLDLDRPEGVVGLYRLGFAHRLNLLDVVLTGIQVGDLQLAINALIDAIATIPNASGVLGHLAARDEVDSGPALAYLTSRKPYWDKLFGARLLLANILDHPIVDKTLALLTELDEAAKGQDDIDLADSREQLITNLREPEVVAAIIRSAIS